MAIRIHVAALCALIPAAAMLSAQTNSTQSGTTEETPFTFKSGVNLVPVPVVVRDSRGNAIGTLGVENFQLFDNGKPQTISKFTVEKLARDPAPKPAAPATASAASPDQPTVSGATLVDAKTEGIPDRFVAYLFDDLHLPPPDLTYTRDAAWRQIQASSDPLQRVAIYTTSGVYMQEFTTDKDKLHATLFKIGGGRVAVDRLAELNCPSVSYYMADLIVNRNDKTALSLARQDAAECQGASQVPGAAERALVNGKSDTLGAFDAMRAVVTRMAAMPGQRTLVLVSPGFLVLKDHHDEQNRLIELAIHDNVVISALDSRGVIGSVLIPDASHHGGGAKGGIIRQAYFEAEASTLAEVMEDIAEGTGGTFYYGSNDYDEGLRLTAATPDYIYVLGFSPADLKLDGEYHKLKIVIKGVSGMELQARKGYFATMHGSDPAEQAKKEMDDALFSHAEVHDLPVTLQTQFARTGNGDATLTAVAEVDVKKLAFRKEDGNNFNNLKVLTGLFDNNGNYISGVEKTVQLKFPDEALKNPGGSGVAVKSDFTAHPGRYVVRMVVRDSEGQLMSELSSLVEIP